MLRESDFPLKIRFDRFNSVAFVENINLNTDMINVTHGQLYLTCAGNFKLPSRNSVKRRYFIVDLTHVYKCFKTNLKFRKHRNRVMLSVSSLSFRRQQVHIQDNFMFKTLAINAGVLRSNAIIT